MDDAASTSHTGDGLRRAPSTASTKVADSSALSRGGTLKKRQSLRKRDSLRRSSSKRSLHAGSIRGVGNEDEDDYDSVFSTPIPTSGNPTEVLAERFQGMPDSDTVVAFDLAANTCMAQLGASF